MSILCEPNEKKVPFINRNFIAMCLVVLLYIEPAVCIIHLRNIISTKNKSSLYKEKDGECVLVDSTREYYARILWLSVYDFNASALHYLNFSLFLLLYSVNAIF